MWQRGSKDSCKITRTSYQKDIVALVIQYDTARSFHFMLAQSFLESFHIWNFDIRLYTSSYEIATQMHAIPRYNYIAFM